MLITRLYLRNFRVYEDELDLALPPGLVGIFGPNGAGKSTLLEAIVFTLWGKSRTTKEQIRSSGTGGDCITEVEFEHEGHLYLVRRTLKGVNSAVSVEAHCDGALMSTGVKDAERYIESVLGMDDLAFRASVFTEQKQLAAFSNHSPAERRRLVMQLLGITPLDAARDSARREARDLGRDHERLRGMLADLAALSVEADDAVAASEAAELQARAELGAAAAAEDRATSAREAFEAIEERRQEHEALVVEGRGVRDRLDRAILSVGARRTELAELDSLEAELVSISVDASGGDDVEASLNLLLPVQAARSALDRATLGPEPPLPDLTAGEQTATALAASREAVAAARAIATAAESDLSRAREASARSALLSGEADCPVCGQALGDAYETVQTHRAQELSDAERRASELIANVSKCEVTLREAEKRARKVSQELDLARQARSEWEQSARRHHDAAEGLDAAWRAAVARGAGSGAVPSIHELAQVVKAKQEQLESTRAAAARVQRIRGRLDQRPGLVKSLEDDLAEVADSEGQVQALRDKVRSLGFKKEELDRARATRDAAEAALRSASHRARDAAVQAATQKEKANSAAKTLAKAREDHAKLADMESEARHVGRAAELLSEFRNTVVASVGPRLALEAAELFGDLTDHEYERLEVNPDTYELQITDGGRSYGLDRFSGSEIDLANLALRVAISEHIHFQSGGSVGLLVLDEVFGPLDEDRKTRMLLALERLKGRFRQVLVVTHDSEIKDQLPNAIEVIKLPGRRATATVLDD